MKFFLLLATLLFMGQRFRSTENSGMGKQDRIDFTEERLIEVKKSLDSLEFRVKSLKTEEMMREITDLKKTVKTLSEQYEDLDRKLKNLNRKLDDTIKKGQPKPY